MNVMSKSEEETNSPSGAQCSQCGTPAVLELGDNLLCVEHYYKMQQAGYMQMSILAASFNVIQGELEIGTGGILGPLPRMQLPSLPSTGDSFTLNNINVSGSTIGAINTGTVRQIDATISVMYNRGEEELADGIKQLTEAIMRSDEIDETSRSSIAEQLAFLSSQLTIDPEKRQRAVVSSVLTGINKAIAAASGLVTIWDKLRPLMEKGLGLN